MKLYLLRHGDAAANAPSDAERPLTTRGEREVLEIAQRCADRLQRVAQVMSSPYLRARQTAAILTRALSDITGYQGELLINPLITPAGQLDEVGAFVDALESEEILLVTHQPLVGYLLNYLTDSDAHGGMTTANLAALELSAFTRGGAKLLWLERPTH